MGIPEQTTNGQDCKPCSFQETRWRRMPTTWGDIKTTGVMGGRMFQKKPRQTQIANGSHTRNRTGERNGDTYTNPPTNTPKIKSDADYERRTGHGTMAKSRLRWSGYWQGNKEPIPQKSIGKWRNTRRIIHSNTTMGNKTHRKDHEPRK